MEPVERRRILAAGASAGLTAGVGTGVTAGVEPSRVGSERGRRSSASEAEEVTHVFRAAGTGGFLAINTDDPQGESYPLPDGEEEPPVVIDGEVYADGTWTATDVEFVTLEPGDFGLPPIDLEVDINVPEGLSGDIDRDAGLMTVEGLLEIFLPLSDFDDIDEDLEVEIDIVDGTTLQSNNMVGDTRSFASPEASMVLVDNAYTVPATDTVVFGIDIDEVLGLPSDEPGDNWFELSFDVEFVPRPPPVVGSNPPTRAESGLYYDDIDGDGDVTIADVQALYANLDSDTVQSYAPAFNFSGTNPERVTVFDVQALFAQVAAQSGT